MINFLKTTNNNIITLFTLFVITVNNAQEIRVIDNKGTINTVRNTQVTRATSAPTNPLLNDVWFDTSRTPNTLNVWDGTAWYNGAWPSNKVTNELCFQDDDYYYVSLLINTTNWEVTRYTKADINIEEKATGTGAQPDDIADVTALTYN